MALTCSPYYMEEYFIRGSSSWGYPENFYNDDDVTERERNGSVRLAWFSRFRGSSKASSMALAFFFGWIVGLAVLQSHSFPWTVVD